MAKQKNLSEHELSNLLKNKNITIQEPIKKIDLGLINKTDNNKIQILDNLKDKTKSSLNINDINKINKESIFKYTVSDNHLSLLFDGARLLSINQIFALLQNKKLKYNVFSYKKCWHNMIKEELFIIEQELKKQKKHLPFFNSHVEVSIFRQAPRLVDEDALPTMFKFIIDALKRTEDNPHGILAEDNPEIVHKISTYGNKGPYGVAVKVKLIDTMKDVITINQILNN